MKIIDFDQRKKKKYQESINIFGYKTTGDYLSSSPLSLFSSDTLSDAGKLSKVNE